MNLVGTYEMKCNYICMYKGANRYQKVVGQNRAGKGILGLFLPWTGAFCFEFSGRGRKSGSAYALVDLVTLAPLFKGIPVPGRDPGLQYPEPARNRKFTTWSNTSKNEVHKLFICLLVIHKQFRFFIHYSQTKKNPNKMKSILITFLSYLRLFSFLYINT